MVEDEINVNKDAAVVWKLLADVNNWGHWARIIDHAVIYGQISPGSRIKCNAGKWDFDGTIIDAIAEKSLIMSGNTVGIKIRFSWELRNHEFGTRVSARAELSGWLVSIFKRRIQRGIQDSIYSWLYSLKACAERGAPKPEIDKKDRHSGLVARKRSSFLGYFGDYFRRQRNE